VVFVSFVKERFEDVNSGRVDGLVEYVWGDSS
jgi:hypothetical protein